LVDTSFMIDRPAVFGNWTTRVHKGVDTAGRSACATAALILALSCVAGAHDIPSDATVHAFLKPSGQRLQLLVRVPLKAMRDVDFPESARGYLDLERLAPLLPDAALLWISNPLELYEGPARLTKLRVIATQVSLDSDRSFASYDEALAHTLGPKLTNGANVVWNQVRFDVLFEYAIHSERSEFSIRPGFERLAARVVTVLRFLPPGGAIRAYEFSGDPGLVHLDPRWHQAARRFVELGFFHILSGNDHLLFLFCLVIPFRRFRALLPVVTAFTVAHSFTLIASAYDLAPNTLWFPPLIETLIAVSIVYMALENIAGAGTVQRRWIIAFGFGLVHGFGFSFALRETLQLAGSHLLASLLSFNIGVELGQLALLLLLIPMLEGLFRFVVAERMGTIVLSALVAHTGWHWMLERWDAFRRFKFQWPEFDAATLSTATLWLVSMAIVSVVLSAAVYAMRARDPSIVVKVKKSLET
ncbi:MAG: HupE/UreJ family protein, partial [Acidobacteriota bacterium]|nr:HupE/UreJ family protein [Acidobacteriota bacterium]